MANLDDFFAKLDALLDREIGSVKTRRAVVAEVVDGQARIVADGSATAGNQFFPVVGDELLIVGDEVLVFRLGEGRALLGPINRASRTFVPVSGAHRYYGEPPSITAGAGAGGPGPSPVIAKAGVDEVGRVNLTCGNEPSPGTLWTLTFAVPKTSSNYEVQLTARSSKAEEAGFRVSSLMATGFSVSTLTDLVQGDQVNLSYSVSEYVEL